MQPDASAPILVIDDSETDLYLLSRRYTKFGYVHPLRTFVHAEDLEAHMAGAHAKQTPMPALILIDLNMPQMSGFELFARLIARHTFAGLPPVIGFSNSDEPDDVEQFIEQGALGLLQKTGLADGSFFRDLDACMRGANLATLRRSSP